MAHFSSHPLLTVFVAGAFILLPGAAFGGAGAQWSPTRTPTRTPLRVATVSMSSPADLRALTRLGVDVLGRLGPGRVRVALTDEQIALLRDRSVQVTVLEPDLAATVRRRLGADTTAYHSLAAIAADLDRLHAARPDLIGPRVTIGQSWEGRPLWAVKVSDHPELDEAEPAVLFDALHHGREPVGMETLLHFLDEVIRRYDGDPAIRALIDAREIWCVPVVNPDGYAYGGPGGLWRKNRRPNADGSFGVDLNRNYAQAWGAADGGSSSVPASATYRGPAPFSEPETAALRDFAMAHGFRTGMTLHGFGDLYLLPCTSGGRLGPDIHEEVAHELEQLTGHPHGKPHEILYSSNGRAQDWFASELGMLSIQPEIGSPDDGFWPRRERLRALVAKQLPALLHVAAIAGPHPAAIAVRGRAAGPAASGSAGAAPGATVELVLSVRNKGLAPAAAVAIEVTTSSPYARVRAGRMTVPWIPAATTIELDATPLRLEIDAAAPIGEPIPLAVLASCAGAASPVAHLELMTGTPTLLFADRGDQGLSNWVAERGWGIAPSGGPGGSAFADSPQGTYAAHANAALALRPALDLRHAERVVLSYRERIATEPWQDRCLVEAWTPRRGWEPLVVHPGGVESSMRPREVSLAAYAGEPEVRLRFRLTANGEREADGWVIDDVEVWAYGTGDRLVCGRPEGGSTPHPADAAAAAMAPLEAAE